MVLAIRSLSTLDTVKGSDTVVCRPFELLDNRGNTPLLGVFKYYDITEGFLFSKAIETIEAFLSCAADPNTRTRDEETLLYLLTKSRRAGHLPKEAYETLVMLLLEAGVNNNARGILSGTVLFDARISHIANCRNDEGYVLKYNVDVAQEMS